MALSTLSGKLNNKSEFTRSEILSIVKLLNLKKEEIYNVFFLSIQFVKNEIKKDEYYKHLKIREEESD